MAKGRTPGPDPNALRDHLANERTLLSWIRTAIAMIGLGFIVARFGLVLHEIAGTRVHHLTEATGNAVGVLLVLSGVGTTAFAVVNFDRIRRGIDAGEVRFSPLLALVVALVVIVVSVILTVYLIVTG